MANLFPKYLSDAVTEKLRSAGVDILTGRMVKEITQADGKVNIKLDNDSSVAADHLSAYCGCGASLLTSALQFSRQASSRTHALPPSASSSSIR